MTYNGLAYHNTKLNQIWATKNQTKPNHVLGVQHRIMQVQHLPYSSEWAIVFLIFKTENYLKGLSWGFWKYINRNGEDLHNIRRTLKVLRPMENSLE